MRIAIIGTGISGLVAAYRLADEHDVTLFEASDYIGGHTHTVDVEVDGEHQSIDTGFIVFNDWTYPHFIELLNELGVDSQPTSMSFSVRCERTGLEYNGTSLNGLFCQRWNLFRPSFLRMLSDIVRFNREAVARVEDFDESVTVEQFLTSERYSQPFADQYLLPMGAAIWSCPSGTFAKFPIRFIVEFYKNHGLLNIHDRPTWRVIVGGSRQYIPALTEKFRDRIRLRTPVAEVVRTEFDIRVITSRGAVESFDHVIFACHSDQALRMMRQPTQVEREVLSHFPYQANSVVLHTDVSLLPKSRRAWASWNYSLPKQPADRATVTYNMNILQKLRSKHVFCVTLNRDDEINSGKVLGRYTYHHPVFTTSRRTAQARHSELIDHQRTSYCGAYWGNGFHEDGVRSALAVVQRLTEVCRV